MVSLETMKVPKELPVVPLLRQLASSASFNCRSKQLGENHALFEPFRGAHLATTTTREEDVYSLSSPTGGEGWGEEADFMEYPPSP
jgi:hypothetical protein